MSSHTPLLPFLARLRSARILVVEDEPFMARDLVQMLERHGAEVVGPFDDLCETLEELSLGERPALAVLDLKAGGRTALRVAEHLAAAAIPFIFVTANEHLTLPEAYAERPRLERSIDIW
ncbi:response regulator [Xinfangfangia sp. CPCC 101601]|uniref:Response regulator n=1 Tax=Pseudogemmobacter lacusdianii TaxID=3069608 RepID=A0ABU0W0P5_9RHOB|nr:response regulator [Xinfangfangia sp. CPCC 101601]MDQ2066985.1 response regulator [Xinfangfangia sp. CPCC 101601]